MEKGNTATVGRAAERSVPCLAKPATALALADDQVIAFPERRPQKKRRLTTVRKKKGKCDACYPGGRIP